MGDMLLATSGMATKATLCPPPIQPNSEFDKKQLNAASHVS
jgi:hypothetical protein